MWRTVALLFLLCAARPALAQNIAVMPFKGQDVDAVQGAVEDALRDDYQMVSDARVIGTARKMGLTKATDDNLARVARKLSIDALIYAQLIRDGKKLELRVLVRSGKTGAAVGDPFEVKLAGERLEGKQRQEFLSKIADKIARVGVRPDRNRQDPDSEELSERDGSDREERELRDRDRERDERDREKDAEEAAERERMLESLSPEQRADLERSRAVVLSAGAGVTQRSLTFSGGGNLGGNAPPDYSGIMPMVQLDGEIYPWAFKLTQTGWKRHIGVIVNFEKSMFLESQAPDNPMMTIPSDHTRYGLGVVYRMLLGDGPSEPTLKFSMGFNKSSFSTSNNILDLPNVSYTFVDPGAILHYPFSPNWSANFVLRGLMVLSAGQIQDASQYGAGTAFGFDADANVSYAIGKKLSLKLGAHFDGFLMKFTKQGMKSDRNLDGQKDISGAFDRYLGGYLLAGYWF
jgi:hypothetical protein